MAGFGVEMIGDWSREEKRLAALSNRRKVENALSDTIRDFAEETAEQIKEYIRSQPSEWKALDPYTVAKKGSATMLIDTGFYVENIKVKQVRKLVFFVGAMKNDTHPSGVNMATLADWLEYGTKRMPARPHFRPVITRRRREFKTSMKQKNLVEQILEKID